MTIAAKHLDPLVGLDIHIILIPSPAGPIPTPLPHPYVGMVLDPFDYAPFIGATTYINGLPRGQAGTAGIALPPHIPMGGPFAKPPTNESELFMGSAIVCTEDEPQSFLGCMVLSCHDIGMPPPPRVKRKSPPKSMMLPTTVVLSIPMGMLVIIGGPPTISLMGMAFAGAMKGLALLKKLGPIGKAIKKVSNQIHDLAEKAMKKLGLGDALRNKVHKGICAVTGHPVDIATGKVFTDRVDFEMPGPIPFRWERTWFSTSTYQGPLGHGWHHSYDQKLYIDAEVILYQTGDGRHVGLPHLAPGTEYFDRKEKLTFSRDNRGYAIRNGSGHIYRFYPVGGRPANDVPLVEVGDAVGNKVVLRYDDWGRLVQIVDCAGRKVSVAYDQAGRIAALAAPHPEQSGQQVYVARYMYDGSGDLITVWDALGQPQVFEYRGHLLVRETNRNGLSFYFQWDSPGATARCLRTWGDDGIYDHKLTYDVEHKVTVVENSLGYKTTYHHDGALVTKTIDPLGAVTETEYDEDCRVLSEKDQLGRITTYGYDERGNLSESVAPDGATLLLQHDSHDLPARAIDPVGGEWTWKRDAQGRPIERRDPLGRVTQYRYEGPRLSTIIDAAGGETTIGYDAIGSVNAVATPDGATTRIQHNGRGAIIAITGPRGSVRRLHLDPLDRIVRFEESDGNTATLAYDAEGNTLHAKDLHHEVHCTYRGMGRLASRTEAGTTVNFEYDTEERLTGVSNAHGSVYRFELGPTGEIAEERGFDGLLRRYTRDLRGRVLRVDRPGSGDSVRFTEYQYDAGDRIVKVSHSDATQQQYAYRLDGELTAAVSAGFVVTFELDLLGRVLKEIQGTEWVQSEFNARGVRTRIRSSLGSDQVIERNNMGDALGIIENASGYETRFQRDQLGLELERTLPGGVRSRWERDKLGRPTQHSVETQAKQLRAVAYRWEPNDRLKLIINAMSGATEYGHDAVGNLAWVKYADGNIDFRMPDAVGNLFKTEQRTDRQYGPAGQLLAAKIPAGWVHYKYDPEGNLIEKQEPSGGSWRYEWNGAGMLSKVVRPDGSIVSFKYDALGRRVSKTYRGQTTRWVWDGNNPLHEWVGGELQPLPESDVAPIWSDSADIKRREAELQQHLSQGPPLRGVRGAPITWLFEPESFAPMAKLVGGEKYSIATDYLGTPVLMTDSNGNSVWSASMSAFGELRELEGDRHACPFRWPGQYEDAETGLYYNRFRYYDASIGAYTSQDPIKLANGLALYAYASDPAFWADPLGLAFARPYSPQETREILDASEGRPSPKTSYPGHPRDQHVRMSDADLQARTNGGLQRASSYQSMASQNRAATAALNSPEGQAKLAELDADPTKPRVTITAETPKERVRVSTNGSSNVRTVNSRTTTVVVDRLPGPGEQIHIQTCYS